MKTLEYYSKDGTYTVFSKYNIYKDGAVMNVETGLVSTRHVCLSGYNYVSVTDNDGKSRNIFIGRALASTFLGKPLVPQHTADHIDQDRENDVVENIRWLDKKGQNENRTFPSVSKSAFIIERDGVQKTVKEWVEYLKEDFNHFGRKYTGDGIRKYAQRGQYGFRFKTFENIPGEEWKLVESSKNNKGEWYISDMNRVKYKTTAGENVMISSQLKTQGGYPVIGFGGKNWQCHIVSFMTFFPDKYAAKTDDQIVLHTKDDKFDFRPSQLRLGTRSQNTIDAYDNGKYDGKKNCKKTLCVVH